MTRPSTAQLFGAPGTPRVVVVGSGFGGIAAGVYLRRAGIETFTIYESSLGIGGTWWDNERRKGGITGTTGSEVAARKQLYF